MITITRNEEVVLDQVRVFDVEYPNGIPLNALKRELGFHEYDLVLILNELADKNLVGFKDNIIKITHHDKEINTVNSKKDIKQLELNMKEEASYELIKKLVDDKGLISRYTLQRDRKSVV